MAAVPPVLAIFFSHNFQIDNNTKDSCNEVFSPRPFSSYPPCGTH
jgi:hypothetical protein